MINFAPKNILESSSGFAIIPLVVLLLFGIAAGTLLIQSNTSFLPKAATNSTCSDPSEVKLCSDLGLTCQKSNLTEQRYCVDSNNTTCIDGELVPYDGKGNFTASKSCPGGCDRNLSSNTYVCFTESYSCDKICVLKWDDGTCHVGLQGKEGCKGVAAGSCGGYKYNIGGQKLVNAGDEIYCSLLGEIGSPAAPATQTAAQAGKCLLRQVRIPGTDARGDFTIEGGPKEYCDVNNKMYSYRCEEGVVYPTAVPSKDSQCASGAQPAAAQPATGEYTPGVAGECNDKQKLKDKNNPGSGPLCPTDKKCVVDKLETRYCVDASKKDGDTCEASNCPEYASGQKACQIINGLPKCRYPDAAKDGACKDSDKGQCVSAAPYNEECWIFGTNYKYSACRKKAGSGAPTTGAGTPAAGTTRSSTATGPNSAGAPAANNARPASGPEVPRAGQNQPAAAVPAATPLVCGKDKDGLEIPCYSIGIFNKEELTSREAQAKIASVNYESFRKILKDQEEQIGKAVAENAERKIKDAEAAMKACMQ